MQHEIPQRVQANYETERQHRDNPPPAYEDHKLGSAQPGRDLLDGEPHGNAGVPTELIVADVRPIDVVPVEGIPAETQANDFMTPETRPSDARPHDVFPAELR
jgi:hypothetical protein